MAVFLLCQPISVFLSWAFPSPSAGWNHTMDNRSQSSDRTVRLSGLNSLHRLKIGTFWHSYYLGLRKVPDGFPGGSAVKNLPVMQKTRVRSLGREDALEEGVATHSSALAGESHGQRSPVSYIHGATKSWIWLKRLRTQACKVAELVVPVPKTKSRSFLLFFIFQLG